MKELSKRVKALAFSSNIDYIGIAPVKRFANAPEGRRPEDLLPGAKSVVSMGMRVSLGPQLTQRIALVNQKKLRQVSFSYRWFGYGLSRITLIPTPLGITSFPHLWQREVRRFWTQFLSIRFSFHD